MKWLHSPDESSEDELVFRPDGYPLPPARGRAVFDDEAGTLREPGPDDRPGEPVAGWVLAESDEQRLTLRRDPHPRASL